MESAATQISGVQLITPTAFSDDRGQFIKIFQNKEFEALGLTSDFKESYFSRSHKGVIRGMHFQTPPHDHEKLVYVTEGTIRDVVLDIRIGSPTYGKHIAVELSAENKKMLYIPRGIAHGFAALTDNATVTYLVTSVHAPTHDQGIRYDSFGFDWNITDPIISKRDQGFQTLADMRSPFTYTKE